MKKEKIGIRKVFFLFIFVALPVFSYTYAKYSTGVDDGNIDRSAEVDGTGLQIKSIDTQIVSKHWNMEDPEIIKQQITDLRDLGANYIAVSTPYDNHGELKLWADAIHKAGLNVWFRSHWLNWEGDDNHPSDMTMREYLIKTSEFIRSNPTLFEENDAFTVCVEPEQAFVARKTNVYDWRAYNQFVRDQIETANLAFSEIKLPGKIYTNWISMNGWVVENGLEKETVEKMGVITVDHYTNQKVILPPSEFARDLKTDLERIYKKWEKPIILGEWGYNIEQEVSDYEQRAVVSESLQGLRDLDFLVGVNYWAHMGNSSRLIDDRQGTPISYRPAALELKAYYYESK